MTPREAGQLLHGCIITVTSEGDDWLMTCLRGRKRMLRVLVAKSQMPPGADMMRHAENTFANMLLSQRNYTHGR